MAHAAAALNEAPTKIFEALPLNNETLLVTRVIVVSDYPYNATVNVKFHSKSHCMYVPEVSRKEPAGGVTAGGVVTGVSVAETSTRSSIALKNYISQLCGAQGKISFFAASSFSWNASSFSKENMTSKVSLCRLDPVAIFITNTYAYYIKLIQLVVKWLIVERSTSLWICLMEL